MPGSPNSAVANRTRGRAARRPVVEAQAAAPGGGGAQADLGDRAAGAAATAADWAREFGSGNSGDEDARRATGWRDRVREAAVRAEREARLARAEEAAEAREERAARAAAEDLPGGGELAVDGRTGRAEGEALCLPEGEGPGEAGEGGGGGRVIEVRAYEEGGEPRGDEARPEPRLQPRRREVFTSRKDGARRGGRGVGGESTGGAAGSEAGTGGQRGTGGGEDVEAGEAGAGVEREGPRGGLLWTRRRSDGSKRAKRAHRKAATAAGWGGGGAAARGGQSDSE